MYKNIILMLTPSERTQYVFLSIFSGIFLLGFWYVYGINLTDKSFIDAKSYWLAANMAIWDNLSPYGIDFEAASKASQGGYAHPFVYPPPSIIILSPLALFSYEDATLLILFCSHIAFLLMLMGLYKIHSDTNATYLLILALCGAMVAFSQSSRITLGHGQVNYYVISGLIWFLAAYIGKASVWSGVFGLILATLLKPYFVIFAIFLFFSSGRRMLIPASLASFVLLILTFFLLPFKIWVDWINYYLLNIDNKTLYLGMFQILDKSNFALNVALIDILSSFGAPQEVVQIIYSKLIFIYGGMAALQLAVLLKLRSRGELQIISASTLLFFVYLVAPVSWAHYMLYCAVGATLLILIFMKNNMKYMSAGCFVTLMVFLQPSSLIIDDQLTRHIPTIVVLLMWIIVGGFAVLRFDSEKFIGIKASLKT